MKKKLVISVFFVCVSPALLRSPALLSMSHDSDGWWSEGEQDAYFESLDGDDGLQGADRGILSEMQELLLETTFLAQEAEFFLGLCPKETDTKQLDACLKAWQDFARTLDQDITNNVTRSQEDVSYAWADLALARAQIKQNIAILHESNGLTLNSPDWQQRKADSEEIDNNDEPLCPNYERLCSRFEFARSIDNYVINAQELVAKIEQLQKLVKFLPETNIGGLDMRKLKNDKQDWRRSIASFKRKKERRDFRQISDSDIVELRLVMRKNDKIRDDLLSHVNTWIDRF
jgi:hypothetical protein